MMSISFSPHYFKGLVQIHLKNIESGFMNHILPSHCLCGGMSVRSWSSHFTFHMNQTLSPLIRAQTVWRLELSTNLREASQCPEKTLTGTYFLLKAPTSSFKIRRLSRHLQLSTWISLKWKPFPGTVKNCECLLTAPVQTPQHSTRNKV